MRLILRMKGASPRRNLRRFTVQSPRLVLVAVPFAEPPVIQDEKLHAQGFRPSGKTDQTALGELKKTGLPVIVQDRALFALEIAAHDMVVD